MNPGKASLSIHSALPGVAFPPLPPNHGSTFLSLHLQLETTQWLKANQLKELQYGQLSLLLDHALKTVPYYQETLIPLGFTPGMEVTPEDWLRVPVLTRRMIQDAGPKLHSTAPPPGHGPVTHRKTSGSTGEPLVTYWTNYDGMVFDAMTLRNHLWHGRDLTGKFCVIRAINAANATGMKTRHGWGGNADAVFPKGDIALILLDTPVREQADWLFHHNPDYLLTHPSNLSALLDRFTELGRIPPRLKGVQAIAEVLDDTLKARCQEVLGIRPVDLYSSQEMGNIALECPESGLMHLMSEGVLIEVVDEEGTPCKEGETGRVLCTSLHSHAMPLFRYEIRDYAEVGPPCTCGRGLPTLKRIYGRTRNMMTMPNGDKRWPMCGFGQFRDIAPIRQYQLIQKTLDTFEMKIVSDRPLTPAESENLREVILQALKYPFNLALVPVDQIVAGKNGKLEAFISEVP